MKIMVISSHTKSMRCFRMDMMREFLSLGHEVVAVGSDSARQWAPKFEEEGIRYLQIGVSRNGLNPFKDLKTYRLLRDILASEKPDKIFVYQAKTIVYGALAAHKNGIEEIYPMVAGLGSIFRGHGLKNSIVKVVMSALYRRAFRYSKAVILQNGDDQRELISNGLVDVSKCAIVNGSGVNLEKFTPSPIGETPTFLFVGRLIKDKGVFEYLQACRLLRQRLPNARCLLVGPFDTNPSALKKEELDTFIKQGAIEYFGEQSDVRPYLDQCTTYVLPSYHEGTPKSVLEAMAKGRAIITTDAPGCRETVVDGKNGFLIKPKSIDMLFERMYQLANNQDLNRKMGEESHRIATDKYDVRIINRSIMKIMKLI